MSINAIYSNIAFGPQPVSINPSGTGVVVTDGVTGTAAPRDCTDAWVPF